VIGGQHHKGGLNSFGQVQRDLHLLCGASHASVITTLLDYYALPTDFPGKVNRPTGSPRSRVEHVERAWVAQTPDRRFVPHLALHELEAWVFAAPAHLESWMFDDAPAVVSAITAIAAAHTSPEDINDGVDTAPSKRLLAAFAAYQKTVHGPFAIDAIGIDRIRATCPHFDHWLSQLERIAAQ
jgi:hypothetical protein